MTRAIVENRNDMAVKFDVKSDFKAALKKLSVLKIISRSERMTC